MLNVLASGTLVRDPMRKTAANGNAFAVASMRVPIEAEDAIIASLISFEQGATDALLSLSKGDALAIVGRGKLTTWQGQDGAQRHGLSIVVDRVMTAYQVGKIRKAARAESESETEDRTEARDGAAR